MHALVVSAECIVAWDTHTAIGILENIYLAILIKLVTWLHTGEARASPIITMWRLRNSVYFRSCQNCSRHFHRSSDQSNNLNDWYSYLACKFLTMTISIQWEEETARRRVRPHSLQESVHARTHTHAHMHARTHTHACMHHTFRINFSMITFLLAPIWLASPLACAHIALPIQAVF